MPQRTPYLGSITLFKNWGKIHYIKRTISAFPSSCFSLLPMCQRISSPEGEQETGCGLEPVSMPTGSDSLMGAFH